MKIAGVIIPLFIISILLSCKKDEIPDYVFTSPFENNSGVEIFNIDTIILGPGHDAVYFFFKDDSLLLYAISVADSIVVFRNGQLYYQENARDHTEDTHVSLHTTYTYNFALRDTKGVLTKLSQPYTIQIP